MKKQNDELNRCIAVLEKQLEDVTAERKFSDEKAVLIKHQNECLQKNLKNSEEARKRMEDTLRAENQGLKIINQELKKSLEAKESANAELEQTSRNAERVAQNQCLDLQNCQTSYQEQLQSTNELAALCTNSQQEVVEIQREIDESEQYIRKSKHKISDAHSVLQLMFRRFDVSFNALQKNSISNDYQERNLNRVFLAPSKFSFLPRNSK